MCSQVFCFYLKYSLPWVLTCIEQLLICSLIRKRAETTGMASSEMQESKAGVAMGLKSQLTHSRDAWPKPETSNPEFQCFLEILSLKRPKTY